MVHRVLICVFLCGYLHCVDSFCGMVPTSGTNHCQYKDRIFALDSTFTDYTDCIEYSCGSDGSLSFCGIGIKAGVFHVPGCTVVRGEKCAVKLVDINDKSMDCQSPFIG